MIMKNLIIIPIESNEEIEKIRDKYNKENNKPKPHITLIYDFNDGSDNVIEHVRNISSSTSSFNITLKGFDKSKIDYYLYLLVDEGKEDIINLHDKLKTGPLINVENSKMPEYIPHYSLVSFKQEREIDKVLKELDDSKVEIKLRVDKIRLLRINEKREVVASEDFELKKSV